MTEPIETPPIICGRCGYFKRTDVTRGKCRFYNKTTYSNSACMASQSGVALPKCLSCGKEIEPARTVRSGSRYCDECFEVEQRRREERYLTFGREIAAAALGGNPPRQVVWCISDLVSYDVGQHHSEAGELIGGLVGGIGAAVGEAIGSSLGQSILEHKGLLWLLAIASQELVLVKIGPKILGGSPILTVDDIKSECSRADIILEDLKADLEGVREAVLKAVMEADLEADLKADLKAGMEDDLEAFRIPAPQARVSCDATSITLEVSATRRRQFFVPRLPEIPDQPTPDAFVSALRELGAPLTLNEFIKALFSGSPAFSLSVWRSVVTDDSYWKELVRTLSDSPPESEDIFEFLSGRAALSVPELCDDRKYIDLLGVLYETLGPKQKLRLVQTWLEAKPAFLGALAEKIRLLRGRPLFGKWLTPRPFRQLEEWASGQKGGVRTGGEP